MKSSVPPTSGLSQSERELIARAREQRQQDSVPSVVRERLLARAQAEARGAERMLPRPLPLVRVRSRGAAQALGAALTMAAALVLFARWRGQPTGDADPSAAGEPIAGDARRVGAGLFQSELFRAPAAAYAGPVPSPTASLFGQQPFSPQSHAWQARRWDDLGAEPSEPARYEHEGSALCVQLGPGERVVAGWPWLPRRPDTLKAPESRDVPAPVALEAGGRYQLVFKAWAREPLPEQLLIAVGHARVPFSGAGGARVEPSTEPRWFSVDIVPRYDDPSVGVAFLANAARGSAPGRVCVSDVTLRRVDSR